MIVADNPAEELASEEFPVRLRPLVPSALKRAYLCVDQLMEQHTWLQTPSSKFQRGDLIVIAAEYEFFKLISAGHLPFEPVWSEYHRPTGKHLVMRGKRANITINQVETEKTFPRRAEFRCALGLPNTSFLFKEWNEALLAEGERKHLLLLHGYQTLTFANLAMPNVPSKSIAWKSENLLKLPHQVYAEAPEEGPSESPDPEALENLLRSVRDNSHD